MEQPRILLTTLPALEAGTPTEDRFSEDPLDYARIYADGKLDDELGYDIMSILKGGVDVLQACLGCTTVPVRITDISKPCTLYGWHSIFADEVRMVAFVVFDDDAKAVARAKAKQAKCPTFT